MADTSEFSRMVDRRSITAAPITLTASPDECIALARRFAIVAVKSLEAVVSLEAKGEDIHASGSLTAEVVQSCAVSGDDLDVAITERLALHFVPAGTLPDYDPDEEVELTEEELDQIPYDGTMFDLGEAVAQTLALAIDPYLEGPNADEARRRHGLVEEGEQDGPLADMLRGLKKD